MISVRSLVAEGDDLVPIGSFQRQLSREEARYIYGAIELVLDGVPVLDRRFIDLVDQLWAYLVEMMERAESDGQARTFLPDSPTEIVLGADRRTGRATVEVRSRDPRRGSCGYAEFFTTMCAEARAFFQAMRRIAPGDAYDETVRRLDGLQQRWPAAG